MYIGFEDSMKENVIYVINIFIFTEKIMLCVYDFKLNALEFILPAYFYFLNVANRKFKLHMQLLL
jgi:hypothetical protein